MKEETSKYNFKGMTSDNSFFKTNEAKTKFLRDIQESTRPFIEEQDRKRTESYASSQFKIIY